MNGRGVVAAGRAVVAGEPPVVPGEPSVVPAEIRDLEREITAAFQAFDEVDAMSLENRARVTDELGSSVPDAASAAAWAGHGVRAVEVVTRAALRRPVWSDVCPRWDALIADSLEAAALEHTGVA